MTDLTGRILKNRYRIDAYLGRGGMAEVYRAYDTRRSYPVAIKVMHPDLAEDREFVRRFRTEAESLATLAHDNIVRFYSLEKEKLLIFLVMDFVDGITLRTLIAQADGPLSLGQVAHVFPQMSRAIHFAHEENIIHRDIKPGNIMIRPDGRVLVTDFGIAKVTDAATITTFMPGTPAYMSPEQCRSESLDRRSDVYALGVVLFEMATGRKPFVGDTEETTGSAREKVRWEQMHTRPPSPRELNVQVPEALEQVVLKALAKKPKERFATALDMSDAFDAAMGAVSKEVPPVTVELLPPVAGEVPFGRDEPVSEVSISTTFQRWLAEAQRKPQMTALVVVIALALLGTGFWSIFGSSFSPPTSPSPSELPTVIVAIPEETDEPETSDPQPETGIYIVEAIVVRTSDVYEGPGGKYDYAAFTQLTGGADVQVKGRNEKSTWLQIIHPDGPDGNGWIDADMAEIIKGDLTQVSEVTVPPPTSTSTPTNTSTPTKTPTKTPTRRRTPTSTKTPTRTPTITPTPQPLAEIRGGQPCPGRCYDYGSRVDYCVGARFSGQAKLTFRAPNGDVHDLGTLSLPQDCLYGFPIPEQQGSWQWQVEFFDSNGNYVDRKVVGFNVCDC
jgi:serine/threonine protein kinase